MPPGLFELIAGNASFAEVIHRDRGSRLHLIAAGRGSVEPSSDLDLALEALSQTYDYVVIAMPPAESVATRALAPGADFVLLVGDGDAADAAARDALVRNGVAEVFTIVPEGEPETLRESARTAA